MSDLGQSRHEGIPTGISLIAVKIQLVRASCRLDMLIGLNRINPCCPPASRLGVWPATVGFEHSAQPEDPRGDLDVHKGDGRSQEKWTFGIGCRD